MGGWVGGWIGQLSESSRQSGNPLKFPDLKVVNPLKMPMMNMITVQVNCFINESTDIDMDWSAYDKDHMILLTSKH